MGITVKDIIENGPLKNCKLWAGQQNLNNEIKMVLILEVPTVLRWIKGGEILLTAGYVFKDDVNMGIKLIKDLAHHNIAALVIKPGQYIKKIPQQMIECAQEVGLPLIEIPPQMPYADIMLPIFENIVNEQYYRLKRVKEVHEKFFNLLLKGGNIESISRLLSSLVENPAFIVDSSGNIRGKSIVSTEEQENLSQALQDYLESNPDLIKSKRPRASFPLALKDKEFNSLLFRIENERNNHAFLVVIEYSRSLDQQDFLAIYQASTIIALEMEKERAVFEAEHRLGSDLLEDILFGALEDFEGIKRRASFLNFNLAQEKTVFVIRSSSSSPVNPEREFYLDNLKFDILKSITRIFKNYPGGILLSARRNRLVGIVNSENQDLIEEHLKKVAKKLAEIFKGEATFYFGVGRTQKELKDLPVSYKEALLGARVSEQMNKTITFHNQLGVLELLFDLRKFPSLKRFNNRYLNPIREYDQKNQGELIKTLQAYFTNNLNLINTAKALFIHKNTVNYRLQKIQKITGLDLKNSEDQITLHLALKANMVLDNR